MQLHQLFEKHTFDFVYHLGAEFGRWNGEDFYDNVWRSNAQGTKNILKRMQEKYKFKHIFFSSSEVYGDYDGVMSEDVLEKVAIRQMNDYAISKWVSEMQIMNSADMFGSETVRIRLFNTCIPEYYSTYRSVICMFVYNALHNIPYTVFKGHTRTSTYITDMINTIANIADNFIPGEVYNIGGLDYHDIKTVSDLILKYGRETKFSQL